LFPAENAPPVLIADIADIVIERTSGEGEEEQWRLVSGEVDVTVRLSHIATSTIQELLCGPTFQDVADGSTEAGPRVLPESVQVSDTEIRFDVDADLALTSVQPQAFSATIFDQATGWSAATVSAASVAARTVTVTLQDPLPTPTVLRFIASGHGPTPLLGANMAPLAGRTGGPSAPPGDGVDFVLMHQRS
jgi:hypothetical protein